MKERDIMRKACFHMKVVKFQLYQCSITFFFSLSCVSYLTCFRAVGLVQLITFLYHLSFFFLNDFLSEPSGHTERPATKSSHTELAGTERNHLIMQNFAKAIWQVLKQYRDKLKVII